MTAKADCRGLIIFLMCLLGVVKISAQCETPKPGGNRILTPESNKPTYSDGDTVTFQCIVGYRPVNPRDSKTLTCSGNSWDYSTLALQCTKKTCGPLPDFPNGRYIYSPEGAEGILFGASAAAQCNEGYQLLLYRDRNCRDSGWDGREPVCEVVKCLPPPEIPNGQPDEPLQDVYEYGQAVTYVCNAGYTRFGDSIVSCSNNGTFQPSPPECEKVSCDPPSVLNGNRVGGIPPYKYKSTIEFACTPGFKMEGSASLLCERNGWNPPPPNCTEVFCDAPSVPNGKIIYGTPPYRYKSTIEFDCDSGFKLEGSGSLVCETKGWNPPPPKCTEVFCDPPSVLNGKIIHGTPPYRYKSTIEFACNSGFKMEGSGSLVCEKNGWNSPLPKCTEVFCDPPSVLNGKIIHGTPPYKYKSTIKFDCDSGFKLEGSGSLVCETKGWNSPPPKCTGTSSLPNHTVKIVAGVFGALGILGLGIFVWYYTKKRSSARGYSGNVAKNEEGAL
ncbi:hypothetical protein SRHO_G00145100 [Serrasalmus rhombeus]